MKITDIETIKIRFKYIKICCTLYDFVGIIFRNMLRKTILIIFISKVFKFISIVCSVKQL